MLSFDPYACFSDQESYKNGKDRVLGGQACLWAEQTDETNLETVVWPRTAALAELFWTGDKVGGANYPRGKFGGHPFVISDSESLKPEDTVEALPRMHDIRYRMVDRGVRAVPLQPHWCALRPGASL